MTSRPRPAHNLVVQMSQQGDVPWYRALTRRQWYALLAANLGWLFDGYETYALILTVGPTFRELLPNESQAIPFYAGVTIAITLLGWGVGGIIGGVLADYIGRKRTLIYAVFAYSILTGFTALAWSWWSFVALRFVVGLAIGSEWATGTAMVAEMWPDRHRGKGSGLMQCGLGIGFFLASAIWLVIGPLGPGAWRWMYVIGVLPALATLWIRKGVDEPAKWAESDRRRRLAVAAARRGESSADAPLTRFTLYDLFQNAGTRRLALIAFVMSTATTLGWWGISTWVPPYVASVAAAQGLSGPRWASLAGMAYNAGAVVGYIALGFCADAWGRRPVVIAWFALALILTPVLFLWTDDLQRLLIVCGVNAVFSLGQYTWCPTWLPEAFPTHIRATAVSFCFNAPRFVAFLGPLVAGALITSFGNYGHAAVMVSLVYLLGIAAAPFFPETVGKPLPD
ncbi:MAG: MFS transporter [Vicinamibacterales bacterium]